MDTAEKLVGQARELMYTINYPIILDAIRLLRRAHELELSKTRRSGGDLHEGAPDA